MFCLQGGAACAYSAARQALPPVSPPLPRQIWDTKKGDGLRTLGEFPKFVRSIAFSADGSLLAAALDERFSIQLFDTATWQPTLEEPLLGHTAAVRTVIFKPPVRPPVWSYMDLFVLRVFHSAAFSFYARLSHLQAANAPRKADRDRTSNAPDRDRTSNAPDGDRTSNAPDRDGTSNAPALLQSCGTGRDSCKLAKCGLHAHHRSCPHMCRCMHGMGWALTLATTPHIPSPTSYLCPRSALLHCRAAAAAAQASWCLPATTARSVSGTRTLKLVSGAAVRCCAGTRRGCAVFPSAPTTSSLPAPATTAP